MYSCLKNRRVISKDKRRGVAAVEFAVVLPLFLLLLAGIIEFGQAFRIQHTLSSASRLGARSAVVNGATTSQVVENVKNRCTKTLGVNDGNINVEVSMNGSSGAEIGTAEKGDEVSVTVSIPYSEAGVGFYANLFSETVLTSTCTFEHE